MRREEIHETASRMIKQEMQRFLDPGPLGYDEAKHPSAACV